MIFQLYPLVECAKLERGGSSGSPAICNTMVRRVASKVCRRARSETFILKAFAQLFLTIINRHLVNNTIQLKHGVRIPVLHFALTDTHMLGYRFI